MADKATFAESSNKSGVWGYFLKQVGIGQKAKCKVCGTVLSTKGGSTSGLLKHWSTVHKTVPEQLKVVQEPQRMPLFQKAIIDLCYARMVAADGITYYTVARCKDIRLRLVARRVKPVSSPNTVRTKVLNFAKFVREKIKEEISELLSSKQFITVTMDEWTSVANKKYANINVHTKGKFFNLDLIRIHGSGAGLLKCALTSYPKPWLKVEFPWTKMSFQSPQTGRRSWKKWVRQVILNSMIDFSLVIYSMFQEERWPRTTSCVLLTVFTWQWWMCCLLRIWKSRFLT